jgi:hypothetical protein
MPDINPVNSLNTRPARAFRRGQWVEVRRPGEIQATLDAEGKFEGLPFMPEMIAYCGRKFRVMRRADRIYLDRRYYVVKVKNAVFLDSLRCDGSAHDGCQNRCEFIWKEAWLKPADPPRESEDNPPADEPVAWNLVTRNGDRYICLATEIIHASKKLNWWDPRHYVQEITLGEISVGRLFLGLARRAGEKIKDLFTPRKKIAPRVPPQPTPTQALNLQPGEWVEVKSLPEIQATLDADGRNRGLGFAPEQAEFCGKRLRVAGRVEKLILEWNGKIHPIANTVELEEATCKGSMCRYCTRNCYHLWREIWLRRMSGP